MGPLFVKLWDFTRDKFLWAIIILVLLGGASMYAATKLETTGEMATMISKDSTAYKDFREFQRYFSGDVAVVLIEGDMDQIISPENRKAMSYVEDRMGKDPHVLFTMSPVFALPKTDGPIPASFVLDADGKIKPQFSNFFFGPRDARIAVGTKGELSYGQLRAMVKETRRAVEDAHFQNVKVFVSGSPVFYMALQETLSKTLTQMMIIASVLMLVVLAVIFRVRGHFAWRWLCLGVVILAIIYTFGVTGALGYKITFVSMAMFPIVLGLGVDYAIQFQNRYDEEIRKGRTALEAIHETLMHIGPAIFIAISAAVLGFAALLFSQTPMVKDFAMMLIMGVVICLAVSLTLLLGILYQHGKKQPPLSKKEVEAEAGKMGFVEKGLKKAGPWIIDHPVVFAPVLIGVAIAGWAHEGDIKGTAAANKFASTRIQEMDDLMYIQELAGGYNTLNVLVTGTDMTDPAILNWMLTGEQNLMAKYSMAQGGYAADHSSVATLLMQFNGNKLPQSADEAKNILSKLPAKMTVNFITADYTAANIMITSHDVDAEPSKTLKKQMEAEFANPPNGAKFVVTNTPVTGIKLVEDLDNTRTKTTYIGIGFIFAILLILYRLRIFRVLSAIIPIIIILGWSGVVIWILDLQINPFMASMSAQILGIGTEFTVLLLMRYYEERDKGESPHLAMETAMTKIGRAIIASGFTVIAGFAALMFALDLPMLMDFGKVTVIDAFLCLVSTLVLLPGMVVWFDTKIRKQKEVAKVNPNSVPK